MKLIMAPTSVGIVAAAKALQDEGLCDKVKVSGLGVPKEMLAYTMNGCAPEFALWSFVDLGYLTYYTAYELATGSLKAEAGAKFTAGRMGEYTITKDPTRDGRSAHPDGAVLGLQQRQRRGRGERVAASLTIATGARTIRAPVDLAGRP